ncbi:MAG: hypothetical protein A6F72_06180 [Cycloclasticus sp. symbiont of Poecilosclerida sp. N]|nr:MAG: hypothetical protein A6F72_06180 [Cycloclasticus sp. symbiont of Poecilosclerida sp. N]
MKFVDYVKVSTITFIIASFLSGCGYNTAVKNWKRAIFPSDVTVEKSAFDGVEKYSTTGYVYPTKDKEPGFLGFNPPVFSLEAIYTKNMNNHIHLGIKIDDIKAIQSVDFNIDGTKTIFDQFTSSFTDIQKTGGYYSSSKWFKVDIAFIKTLLNSKDAKIRYTTFNRYSVGDFHYDYTQQGNTAKHALRNLLTKINKL